MFRLAVPKLMARTQPALWECEWFDNRHGKLFGCQRKTKSRQVSQVRLDKRQSDTKYHNRISAMFVIRL